MTLLASALVKLAIAAGQLLMGGQEATLLFAGDAMMHQGQIDAARRADGTYDYSTCFADVAPIISRADLAVVNLETPLGGAPYSGYPCFCAPDTYADALTAAGFDLMLTANNHTLDRRDKGLRRTIEQLDSKGIPHVGTYRSKADRDSLVPKIISVKGFKLGILNYTYGTNGIQPQGDVVVNYIDHRRIAADIDAARRKGAELIVAAIHWGVEYRLLPNDSQRSLADFLADKGVELIIGGHPHVIQPMEMRPQAGPDKRPALVVYSLGNFISNMKTRDTRGGAMVTATLRRDSVGRAYVANAAYRLVFVEPGLPGKSNFSLHPAERYSSRQWGEACRAFERQAVDIFNRHNINVARDTTSL